MIGNLLDPMFSGSEPPVDEVLFVSSQTQDAVAFLMGATFDLANYIHTRSKIQHAVSQAARLAVTGNKLRSPDDTSISLSREASIEQVIRHYTGMVFERDQVRIYAVAPDGSLKAGPGGPGDVVLVRVNYELPLVTPGLNRLFPGGRARIQCSTRYRNEQFSVSLLDAVSMAQVFEVA